MRGDKSSWPKTLTHFRRLSFTLVHSRRVSCTFDDSRTLSTTLVHSRLLLCTLILKNSLNIIQLKLESMKALKTLTLVWRLTLMNLLSLTLLQFQSELHLVDSPCSLAWVLKQISQDPRLSNMVRHLSHMRSCFIEKSPITLRSFSLLLPLDDSIVFVTFSQT